MYQPISLAEIQAAKGRIAGSAVRTPLVRLNLDDAPAEIYLKLENLQPIGSFKIRGAVNLLAQLDPASPTESGLQAPGTWPRAWHGAPGNGASRAR
jgi:threonine dehydratase